MINDKKQKAATDLNKDEEISNGNFVIDESVKQVNENLKEAKKDDQTAAKKFDKEHRDEKSDLSNGNFVLKDDDKL